MTNLQTLEALDISSTNTINSYDFLNDFINPARQELNKPIMENRKFNKKIELEFGGEVKADLKVRVEREGRGFILVDSCNLTEKQCLQMAAREFSAVRAIIVRKIEEYQQRLNLAEQAIDAIAISESHEEAVYLARVAKAERNALRIGCKSDNLRIDEIKKQDILGVHGFEHVFLNTRVSMHLFGCAPDAFKKNTGLSMRDYFESISDVENLHKIGRTLERAITLAELGFSKDEIMAKFPANETKYFG